MDETLLGWIFLISMLVWRSLAGFKFAQKCFHACGGSIAPFLQWYTLSFLGLLFLLVRSFFDISVFDYYLFHFLEPAKVDANVDKICQGEGLDEAACQALRAELKIPPWLHKLSLAAPVCGVVAFCVLSYRLYLFVKLNHQMKVERGDPSPWQLAERLDWVVIILGMPLIFIVMAMRSLIRVWAVMTGSGYHPGMDWAQRSQLELATYSMDLELAVAFQFFAVLVFGFLTTSFLEFSEHVTVATGQDSRKYMRTLAYAAVQGVYAFVFVGLLRTLFDISVTYLQELPEYKEKAELIEDKFIAKVGVIFTFVTLLCMLNMVLISKVADIRNKLGNANLKFLGTRLLLLIAQIQPQVLTGLTVGSQLYLTLREHASKFHLEAYFDRWTFTQNQARLAHASALNYECLLVVFATLIFWNLTMDQKEALMRDLGELRTGRAANAREPSEGYQRLLDA